MASCRQLFLREVPAAGRARSGGTLNQLGQPGPPHVLSCSALVLGCLLSSSCGSGSLYTTAGSQTTSAPLSYAGTPQITTEPVVAGQPMTVTFTVQNNTYHILFNVPWQIYLGNDPTQVISSGSIAEITSNGQTLESVQVTAPGAGSYTLTVVVDPGDTLELGLQGGAAATTSMVTVTPAPG
jgi:CARDB